LQLEVVRLISESGEVNQKLPEMLMLNK